MDRPNVVVIVSDDQGYGDLSCMGATDFRTPRLDELARSGARFTSFCVNSPVCSPSRASLLTGRYPGYAGVRNLLIAHRDTPGLAPDVPTLAEALRDAGYSTGLVGKWHLGAAEHPTLVAEMRAAAERWRAGIEEQWERKHAARMVGENAFAVTDSSGLRVYDNPNNPAIGDT